MSNAFDLTTDAPPDYSRFAPKDPPTPPPDYTAKRMDLAAESKAVGEKEIESLTTANEKYQSLANRKTPVPADPKLENLPQPPKQNYTDPIKAFQNPAVVIATLGSLFTRAPLTAAMNAGAAAMTAYHKGEAEVFAQKREEWKEKMDEAIKQNGIELEKYNVAWKKSDAAVKDKMAAMMANAAGQKNEVMIAAIRSGAIDKVDGIYDGLEKAQLALKASAKKFEEQKEIAKIRAGGDQENFTDKTLDVMADQYLAGDKSVFQNLGRGVQGAAAIRALRNKIADKMGEQGISGAQQAKIMAEFTGLTAGERTLGTRTANIEMAVNEAYNMLPLAKAASDAMPRTKWTDLNRLIQAGATHSSDPQMARFLAAHNAVINTYSRAISPTGVPTVADKEHAREIFGTATGPLAYDAVLDQIRKEMEAARKSPGQVRQEFRNSGGNAPEPLPEEPPAATGWKIEKIE